MKYIDLTHTIHETISVFPGTEPPKFKQMGTHEIDGFKETLLTMFSHTGTHVDAPSHIYADGKNLDEFSIESFIGKATIVDISGFSSEDIIGEEHINMNRLNECDFILFYYGSDIKFGTDAFFDDYPVLSRELIQLINKSDIKGLGFDVIGLDKVSNANLDLHKLLFKNNEIINIENLNNLGKVYDEIGDNLFTFIALPLKFRESDGAPIRAMAIIE